MNNQELFDLQVERFLKKQMSEEEEIAFKKEIFANPVKLSRAKAIALAIKQIKSSSKYKDKEIMRSIGTMDKQTFVDIASGKTEVDFDERTSKFLKGKMDKEEEQLYFEELKRSPEKLSRAKIVALAVSQMKSHQKEKDKEILAAIQEMEFSTFCLVATKKVVPSAPQEIATSIALPVNTPRTKYISIKWTMSIAASVLILFAVGLGFHQYDVYQTKKLGDEYGELFCDMQMVSRGSDPDSIVARQLKSTFQNIQRGDSLSEATMFISEVHKTSFSGKYSAYKEYDIYITWNLAIAYLKQGNKKEAKNILKRLITEYADTPIGKKANELLKEL